MFEKSTPYSYNAKASRIDLYRAHRVPSYSSHDSSCIAAQISQSGARWVERLGGRKSLRRRQAKRTAFQGSGVIVGRLPLRRGFSLYESYSSIFTLLEGGLMGQCQIRFISILERLESVLP